MPEAALLAAPEPRVMRLRDVIGHASESGRLVVWISTGDCPWCGFTMTAEAGKRGFCTVPTCAKPALAVMTAGGGQ